MNKVTIKDVAREAMVSPTLVSRVMNAPKNPDGTPQCVVNPKTAERIFTAVQKLGYHPNKAAASLRKGIKKRIGIIIPDISNQFFADIARHLESVASQSGYIVLFGSSSEDHEKLAKVSETFIEDGVDGIIIVPCEGCESIIKNIVAGGTPVITAIRNIPSLSGVSRVLPDDASSVRLAIDHLKNQGYSKIEMISNVKRLSTVKERESIYSRIMSECGGSGKIHHYNPENGIEDIMLIMEDLVRRGVDAIFSPSASIPLRCIEAAHKLKVKIPEDIALIGYDGGMTFKITSPQISQIEYSRRDIAKEAFTLLMERIQTENPSDKIIRLTPSLSIGGSTCPSKEDENKSQSFSKQDIASSLKTLKKLIDDIEQNLRTS